MRSKVVSIENLPARRVALLLRLAGLVTVASGLTGVCIWLADLGDGADGDGLRYGSWHNPFMQFPPFDEAFLGVSMWVLLACSAAAGLGGLMLLVPRKWGVPLVTWQARVSIVTNGVIAFFIVAAMVVFAKRQWGEYYLAGTTEALALRLGSIVADLMLWTFLDSNAVREFWRWQPHPPDRAFEVIMRDSCRSS
jgi:hypothetical protein